jgi:hypothetical protein
MATLGYLVNHANTQDEAVILLAFSHQQLAKRFGHQPELVKERNQILGRMPGHLVAEAQRRARRKPFTWSGLNARQLAAAGGMRGYDEAYGFFSSETHGTLIGENVTLVAPADGETKGTISFGRRHGPNDVESLANFARRSMHSAFKIMWQIFDAPAVEVRTPNPELWRTATK